MNGELEVWLARIGAGEHLQSFIENEIDLDSARDLTEDDLRELGLPMGPRKKVLRAIAALNASGAAPAQAPAADENPAADAREVPAERRQVTVLFADICGYTKLSGELGAEATHALLSAYFEEADAIVERFGGAVDKHIGDSVMAVFGAPRSYGNDSERAVRAAEAIHRAIQSVSQNVGRDINVHIGVACGQVVASGVGTNERYTVTGDSVNLASRLTDKAAPGETLISERVKDAVETHFSTQALGQLSLKGIVEPVHAFRVIEPAQLEGRLADRPFVGRQAELAQLGAVLETTSETSAGHLIYLRGEAGIGKTRMTEEVTRMARLKGFETHRALVLDFGAGKGRDAIRSLVRSLLELEDSSDDAKAARAIATAVQTGIIGKNQVVFMNDILGLAQPPELRSLHTALDNARRNQGLGETAAAVVRNISGAKKLLLVVEDVHWAAPIILQHLAEVVRAISDVPVALIMTSRIEGDQLNEAWKNTTGSTPIIQVDLRPLRRTDAMALATDFLDVTDKFAETCIERADGNPLFLEQLLRGAETAAQTALPGSIQSIVQARVDALEPSDKAAIQAAAILGQRFALETLKHLLKDPSYDVHRLMERHLIRSDGDAFLFAHALVRDGVYDSLLTTNRSELHRAAAAWYKARDLILHAQHLDLAGDETAAAAYLAASQGQADALQFESASSLCQRGLELVGDAENTSDLHRVLAETMLNMRATETAVVHFELAAQAAPDKQRRAKALSGLASALRIADRQIPALDALKEAETIATEESFSSELAHIHYLRGNLYFPLGRIDECMEEHQKSLRLAEQIESPQALARALSGLADAHYLKGHMKTAAERFSACVALCQEHGFGQLEVANLHMIGWSKIHLMQFREALELALNSEDMATSARNDRSMMFSKKLAGSMHYYLGNHDSAAVKLEEAIALSRSMGSSNAEAQGLRQLSMLRSAQGDFDSAREHADAAVEAVRKVGMTFIGPTVLATSASLLDNGEKRRALLQEAEAILDSGCVAHNQLWFADIAIDDALSRQEWGAARRYADRLERLTSAEPLVWSEFMVQRARALIAIGAGTGTEADTIALAKIERDAADCGFVDFRDEN
jgi:class 3 adenylate cyclase/predicted ATPase